MPTLDEIRQMVRALSVEEKLLILQDLDVEVYVPSEEMLQQMRRSEEDIKNGRVYTLEQVRAMLDLED